MKRSLGWFFNVLIHVLTAALPNKCPGSNISLGKISQML